MSLTFFGAHSDDFLVVGAPSGTPAPPLALLLAATQLRLTALPSGIIAPPPTLLPEAAQLRPIALPVPSATFA